MEGAGVSFRSLDAVFDDSTHGSLVGLGLKVAVRIPGIPLLNPGIPLLNPGLIDG